MLEYQPAIMQGPWSGIAMKGFEPATCGSVFWSEVTRQAEGWGTKPKTYAHITCYLAAQVQSWRSHLSQRITRNQSCGQPLPFKCDLNVYVSTCCNAGSMVRDSYEGIRTCDLRVTVLIRGYKKGSRLGHLGISGPTYCLTSCSSVVRALVCQPSGPGSILAVSLKSA